MVRVDGYESLSGTNYPDLTYSERLEASKSSLKKNPFALFHPFEVVVRMIGLRRTAITGSKIHRRPGVPRLDMIACIQSRKSVSLTCSWQPFLSFGNGTVDSTSKLAGSDFAILDG
jgi:hypothetical protein